VQRRKRPELFVLRSAHARELLIELDGGGSHDIIEQLLLQQESVAKLKGQLIG
jgi:hypothetical protein